MMCYHQAKLSEPLEEPLEILYHAKKICPTELDYLLLKISIFTSDITRKQLIVDLHLLVFMMIVDNYQQFSNLCYVLANHPGHCLKRPVNIGRCSMSNRI